MASPEWGTIADWGSAVGTVGTLGLTYALLRQEFRRFREAEVDSEREQAESVAAWVAYGEDQVSPFGRSTMRLGTAGLVVRNASSAPIYAVNAVVVGIGGVETSIEFGVIAPSYDEFKALTFEAVGIDENRISPSEEEVRLCTVALAFTDGAGRRWHRATTGELTKVS